MARNLRQITLIALATFTLAGCYSIPVRQDIASADAPWYGADQRAHAYLEQRSDGVVRVSTELKWTCSGVRRTDDMSAISITSTSDTYLKSCGIERTPQHLSLEGTPWPYPIYRPGGEWVWPPVLRYPTTATVVSLDPIVVLLTPDPMDVRPRERQYDADEAEIGYRYSSRAPFNDHVQWFAPVWSVGPEAPEVVSTDPDQRIIRLPGLELLLTRQGDDWVVMPRKPG